ARASGSQVSRILVVVGSLMTVAAAIPPLLSNSSPQNDPVGRLGWPLLGLAAAMLVVISKELITYTGPGEVAERIARTVFSIVYVGGLMSFLVALRTIQP